MTRFKNIILFIMFALFIYVVGNGIYGTINNVCTITTERNKILEEIVE